MNTPPFVHYAPPTPFTVNCPECGKDEKKIEVCVHCGYQYAKETPLTLGEKIAAVFGMLIGWGLVIMAIWGLLSK